jgi:hypothetical protein
MSVTTNMETLEVETMGTRILGRRRNDTLRKEGETL